METFRPGFPFSIQIPIIVNLCTSKLKELLLSVQEAWSTNSQLLSSQVYLLLIWGQDFGGIAAIETSLLSGILFSLDPLSML